MSNRTAKASRAVAEAWKNERGLVTEGKGTRDWTADQQQDILTKGRAYDEDGKAFEGHHMKSVEAYPEFQACPENIQFLSRAEHRDAHGGFFGNPTNGHYDPEKHATLSFGTQPPMPCEVVVLSDPISTSVRPSAIRPVGVSQESYRPVKPPKNEPGNGGNRKSPAVRQSPSSSAITALGNAREIGKVVGSKITHFISSHPIATLAVASIGLEFVRSASEIIGGTNTSSNGNGTEGIQEYAEDPKLAFAESATADIDSDGRSYPETRKPPRPHQVSGYDRVRFGKEEHISSYPRGGRKNGTTEP